MHILHLDDVGCKHLTSGNVSFKIFHLKHCNILAFSFCVNVRIEIIFSSPGQSPGRAIVLPPASALALALAVAAALAKC